MEQVAGLFSDPEPALGYFQELKKHKPRYIRDQLFLIKKAITKSNTPYVDLTLSFCQTHSIFSANDFKAVLEHHSQQESLPEEIQLEELLLKSVDPKQYAASPQKSNITDYESIVNP